MKINSSAVCLITSLLDIMIQFSRVQHGWLVTRESVSFEFVWCLTRNNKAIHVIELQTSLSIPSQEQSLTLGPIRSVEWLSR